MARVFMLASPMQLGPQINIPVFLAKCSLALLPRPLFARFGVADA